MPFSVIKVILQFCKENDLQNTFQALQVLIVARERLANSFVKCDFCGLKRFLKL